MTENEEKELNKYMFYHVETDVENEIPQFSETRNKDYIQYGDDNNYPRFLLDLLNNSSKHCSAINKKTTMVAGAGFEETNDEKVTEFIDNKNGKESLTNIVLKNACDLNIFGAFGLIVTWSKDKQSIARLKYISPNNFRVRKELSKDDISGDDEKKKIFKLQQKGIDSYGISSDWGNTRRKENKIELIQGFSRDVKDDPTQLLYVRTHQPGVDYYTIPEYRAAIKWILLDSEVVNFHLSGIQRGYTPGMIINFKEGKPTDEMARKIKRKLDHDFQGSSRSSGVFITFSESEGTAPEFIPITLNDSDDRFLQLEEFIMQNLITAHNMSSNVMGVQTAGKLGSSSEIFESEVVFQNNVISPKQLFIENVYNELAKINGLEEKLKLKRTASFSEEFIDEWIRPKQKMNKENDDKKSTLEDKINKKLILNGNK